jgi:hypothetical protein
MQKPGSHLKISIATTAIVIKAAIELGELAVALNQSIHLVDKSEHGANVKMQRNYRGHRVVIV